MMRPVSLILFFLIICGSPVWAQSADVWIDVDSWWDGYSWVAWGSAYYETDYATEIYYEVYLDVWLLDHNVNQLDYNWDQGEGSAEAEVISDVEDGEEYYVHAEPYIRPLYQEGCYNDWSDVYDFFTYVNENILWWDYYSYFGPADRTVCSEDWEYLGSGNAGIALYIYPTNLHPTGSSGNNHGQLSVNYDWDPVPANGHKSKTSCYLTEYLQYSQLPFPSPFPSIDPGNGWHSVWPMKDPITDHHSIPSTGWRSPYVQVNVTCAQNYYWYNPLEFSIMNFILGENTIGRFVYQDSNSNWFLRTDKSHQNGPYYYDLWMF